ncbi:MAG TPA: hypothetical protein VI603_19205 [Saprospiraceae bacterium]|nr:hypothetical protein [Saprospiraceae bacterium]
MAAVGAFIGYATSVATVWNNPQWSDGAQFAFILGSTFGGFALGGYAPDIVGGIGGFIGNNGAQLARVTNNFVRASQNTVPIDQAIANAIHNYILNGTRAIISQMGFDENSLNYISYRNTDFQGYPKKYSIEDYAHFENLIANVDGWHIQFESVDILRRNDAYYNSIQGIDELEKYATAFESGSNVLLLRGPVGQSEIKLWEGATIKNSTAGRVTVGLCKLSPCGAEHYLTATSEIRRDMLSSFINRLSGAQKNKTITWLKHYGYY